MEQNKNDFENVAAIAEEKLGRVSDVLEEVMSSLPSEEMEKEKQVVIEKAAEEFLRILLENIHRWNNMFWNEGTESMKTAFSAILSYLPPFCSEPFRKSVLKSKKWNQCEHRSMEDANVSLSICLSILGAFQGEEEKKQKEIDGDTSPILPLSFHFSKDDFSSSPAYFGAGLEKYTSFFIEGNVGWRVGYEMKGGRIEVRGNTTKWAAESMKGGILEIYGGTGIYTAEEMEGGILTIHGEVGSFYGSAFTKKNMGTIIWKGVTLWNGDWTKDGYEMKKAGKIPGIDSK